MNVENFPTTCPFRKMSDMILLSFTQSSCRKYAVTSSLFTLWNIVLGRNHILRAADVARYGSKIHLQGPGKEIAKSVYTILGFVHSPVWFFRFVIHFWRFRKTFWGYTASVYRWTILMSIKVLPKKFNRHTVVVV